ncbi:putative Zinc finger, MYND-type [Helianthus anomalus]
MKRHPGGILNSYVSYEIVLLSLTIMLLFLSSIKVFRCQLPCHNKFYYSEPPKNDGSDKPLGAADEVCSKCKRVRYYSKAHQAIHWSSTHKTQCRSVELMLQPSNSRSTNSSEDIQTGWYSFSSGVHFVNGHLGQVKIGDLGLAAILRGSCRAHTVIGIFEVLNLFI